MSQLFHTVIQPLYFLCREMTAPYGILRLEHCFDFCLQQGLFNIGTWLVVHMPVFLSS